MLAAAATTSDPDCPVIRVSYHVPQDRRRGAGAAPTGPRFFRMPQPAKPKLTSSPDPDLRPTPPDLRPEPGAATVGAPAAATAAALPGAVIDLTDDEKPAAKEKRRFVPKRPAPKPKPPAPDALAGAAAQEPLPPPPPPPPRPPRRDAAARDNIQARFREQADVRKPPPGAGNTGAGWSSMGTGWGSMRPGRRPFADPYSSPNPYANPAWRHPAPGTRDVKFPPEPRWQPPPRPAGAVAWRPPPAGAGAWRPPPADAGAWRPRTTPVKDTGRRALSNLPSWYGGGGGGYYY